MNHYVGQTSNGIAVYINLISSPAAAVIGRQPRLLEMAKRALAQSAAASPVVRIESDMGRPVGYNYVVSTSDSDVVFYAQLLRDSTYSRFVKNGKPAMSKYLSLVLRRDKSGKYELNELWVGRLRPARPGSDGETAESRSYWQDHAYVPDIFSVQPRSITKVCPY